MAEDTIVELEKQLEAAEDPIERVFLMNRLAQAYVQAEPRQTSKAVALSEAALEDVEFWLRKDLPSETKEELKRSLVDTLQLLGDFYIQLAHFDLALSFLLRSLTTIKEFSAEDDMVKGGLYEAISRTYGFLGEFPSALDYALSALEIYREHLDKLGQGGMQPLLQPGRTIPLAVHNLHDRMAHALAMVGEMQLRVGNVADSRKALEQSADIAHRISAMAAEANALENLVRLYVEQTEDHSVEARIQAETWLETSMRLYREMGDRRGEVRTLICQGDLNLLDGVFTPEGAIRILTPFQKALELAEQGDFSLELIQSLFKLGQAYHSLGHYEQSLIAMLRALEQAQSARTLPVQFEIHQWLASVYRDMGDFQKALEHYEQFYKLRETVFNKQSMERVRNLQVLHQVESARREAELSRLRSVVLEQEIEDRRRAENSLKQVNQQLYDEIQARELLISDLDAFAQMVAHDLKTPLTSLALSNKLLQRIAEERSDASSLDLVQKSQRTVEKMNSIITELLVLASVRQERVLLAELNMQVILADVRHRLAFLIEEFGAQVSLAQPAESWPTVLGYGPWIEEVWANYLSNAIKYGGKPPRVTIGAERIPESMFVRFWVRDNGSGISEEQQIKLFRPFSKPGTKQAQEIALGASRLSTRSTGLGLSIVKRIVEKLGGEVWVESSGLEGEGSCFSFSLPASL